MASLVKQIPWDFDPKRPCPQHPHPAGAAKRAGEELEPQPLRDSRERCSPCDSGKSRQVNRAARGKLRDWRVRCQGVLRSAPYVPCQTSRRHLCRRPAKLGL